MNIGAVIEKVRKAKNISQGDLAQKAEIIQSYLSQIENNKREPNLKTIKILSEVLETPLSVLLIMSLTQEDIPEDKQQEFKVIMPLVNTLIKEYFHD